MVYDDITWYYIPQIASSRLTQQHGQPMVYLRKWSTNAGSSISNLLDVNLLSGKRPKNGLPYGDQTC